MTEQSDEIAALKAELAELRTGMAELQASQGARYKRPLIDRLGAWGGFLALLIALATGTITFWDDVVLRGERQEQARVETLRGWLNELTTINTQIQQAQATGNLQHVNALVGSFSATKDRLLRSISEVYRERPELFTERDMFLLAHENLALGDKRSADNLMQAILARDGSTGQPHMMAELTQLRARVRGLVGDMHDPVEARALYREAYEWTGQLPEGSREGLRVNILNEWLQFETTPSGDCDMALSVLDMAVSELESDIVAQGALDQYRMIIAQTLDMAPARCRLPRG